MQFQKGEKTKTSYGKLKLFVPFDVRAGWRGKVSATMFILEEELS
jgi:hypothetical protein